MNITSESSFNFSFKREDLLSDNTITEYNNKNNNNNKNNRNNKKYITNIHNGGGLFCTDEFTKILLECFSDDRPDIVCYLLCKLDKIPNDLTLTLQSKRNILHYLTIYASHNNIVVHLSKLLRDTDKNHIKSALNSQDDSGNTPLHYAIISNKKNSALELIAYMRRNNPRTSTGHFNPLLDCCNKYDDWNPLQTAVYFNNLELVEALLDSGANPNSCSNQRIKCRVRGANITVEVFIDMPLHMASSNGNIEIINKLINFGASKSLINYNSGTALHIAAKKGDTVCLSALLDRGCDPLIVNIKRQNAFDVAPEKVRAFMIDYLKSKQALKA